MTTPYPARARSHWEDTARETFRIWFEKLPREEQSRLRLAGIASFDTDSRRGCETLELSHGESGHLDPDAVLSELSSRSKYARGISAFYDDFLEEIEPSPEPRDRKEMHGVVSAVVATLCAAPRTSLPAKIFALAVFADWSGMTVSRAARSAKVSESSIAREIAVWKREPSLKVSSLTREVVLRRLLNLWLAYSGSLSVPVYVTALFFGHISTQTDVARKIGMTRQNVSKFMIDFLEKLELRSAHSKPPAAVISYREAALKNHWRKKLVSGERVESDLALLD